MSYDLHPAGDRRAAMERQSHASLAVLGKKCQKEVTACNRLGGNAVKDLFNTHISSDGTSLAGSSSHGAAPIASTSKSEQIQKELFNSEHREDILQTAKKRCANVSLFVDSSVLTLFQCRKRERTADGTTSTNNNTNTQGGDSPTKPRKHMRTTSTSHATAPETVVRTGSTASRGASTSVYRARPSHAPYGQLNPRLPQTPHLPSLSSGRTGTMSRMTATQRRRLPKRNESIQAYSMNGSPLGILEIDVKQQQRAKAASQASSSVVGTSEADPLPSTSAAAAAGKEDGEWEFLHRPPLAPTASSSRVSTVSQQYKAHQQRSFSPTKPLGSISINGSTTGKMKAAFASKFGHHSQAGPFSPSKQQFTMQVPNDASRGRKEWDAWTEAFKRDLGNMSGLSAQDKKILEDRLRQMGLS